MDYIELREEIVKELNISPDDLTALNEAGQLIQIKLGEGYTTDDIATVVTFYKKEWTGKMEKYFRPLTLFSDHFAEYLEEARKQGRAAEH